MDPPEVLLHLVIGYLTQEMEVFWVNEDFSLLTQRNLQAVGTAYCLQKQALQGCIDILLIYIYIYIDIWMQEQQRKTLRSLN